MTEEKKEEKTDNTAAQAAPAPEPAAAPAPAPAKSAQEKAPAVKKEKPSNCAGCNKSIRKKRWYYRNGKSYCSKRCWQAAVKKEDKASAEAAVPETPK